MDRLRQAFKSGIPYKQVETEDVPEDEVHEEEPGNASVPEEEINFSWLNYTIFLLLGVAMLWAWYVVFTALTICEGINICPGICF